MLSLVGIRRDDGCDLQARLLLESRMHNPNHCVLRHSLYSNRTGRASRGHERLACQVTSQRLPRDIINGIIANYIRHRMSKAPAGLAEQLGKSSGP